MLNMFMRQFTVLHFLTCFNIASAQYNVKLGKDQIDLKEKTFEVIEVLDWRSNKDYLGIVYRSIDNTPKVAVIDGHVEQVIFSMIQSAESEHKVIIGLRKLTIKEVIKTTTEFGYAEVELHAVLKVDKGYHDLGIYRYVSKYSGVDVTGKHAKHIGMALKHALDQISLANKSAQKVPLSELENQRKDVRWVNLPVIDLHEINYGLYLNFASLKENRPDSIVDFQIKGKKNPSLYFQNEKKKFNILSETTFFLAVNNEGAFIGFDDSYYKTVIRNGKWLFTGPKMGDQEAINDGIIIAGLFGGAIVGAATKDQFVYQVNTIDGSIRAVSKLR